MVTLFFFNLLNNRNFYTERFSIRTIQLPLDMYTAYIVNKQKLILVALLSGIFKIFVISTNDQK